MFRKAFTISVMSSIALAACAVSAPSQAQDAVTLDYWAFSDYAQGDALKMQQEFITEFTDKHPGVTINIAGKGDDDLTAGEIAGAASGTLPAIFMNGLAAGAQLAKVGALANLYDKWMAMPQSFRDQFNKKAIASCMPKPDELLCLPYTGFGSILFRNLDVLKAAGVDTSKPPATWAEWLDQMKKVSASGKYAVPDQTLVFNSVAATYAMVGTPDQWGIDFSTRKTKIDPDVMKQVLQMFVDMAPLNSGTSRNDQSTKDLFISGQLAFHAIGPWVNPTYEQAAKESGLNYDFTIMPGMKDGEHGGIKSYEIIGIAPGKNEDLAWQFATYLTSKGPMVRWAKLLSRYNANVEAMADPSVAALPLVKTTDESANYALDVQPPYFVDAVPSCYTEIVTDIASATADGDMTPDEGATKMIKELNDCLAD